MPNPFRRSVSAGSSLLVPAFLMCFLSVPASQAIGQSSNTPITPLQKQLNRVDFAISASGEIGTNVSGTEKRDANVSTLIGATTYASSTNLTIVPSSTVGELFTLRYIAKPLIGFELNLGNVRFTQNYTYATTTTPTPPNPIPPSLVFSPLGSAQVAAREMTLGYVAHFPYHPFGVTPFLGAGGGTIKFTPTAGGGQGLPFQYRAAYYYTAGLEDTFPNSPFGVRLGFRQLIYLAPDFEQNYLTITRRVITSEPNIGIFVRF